MPVDAGAASWTTSFVVALAVAVAAVGVALAGGTGNGWIVTSFVASRSHAAVSDAPKTTTARKSFSDCATRADDTAPARASSGFDETATAFFTAAQGDLARASGPMRGMRRACLPA